MKLRCQGWWVVRVEEGGGRGWLGAKGEGGEELWRSEGGLGLTECESVE